MTKTRNFAVLFAASGLAVLAGSRPVQAQTVITLAAFATGNSPGSNLTTLGSTDWAKWGHDTNTTTFVNKGVTGANSNPVGDISNVTPITGVVPGGPGTYYIRTEPDPNNSGDTNVGTTVSWTDGSNASYLPSDTTNTRLSNAVFNDTYHAGLGNGWSFTVLIPSMSTGTLYLYEGGYNSTDTLRVTSSDGSAGSSASIDNLDAGNGYFAAAVTNTASTSDTLSFMFYESASNGKFDNPKIEAAALSLQPFIAPAAPEPSQFAGLGFAAFGVLGLLFKAKGRIKSNHSAAPASV